MTGKSIRNLLCAAAAAVFWAYGTAAHAIAYDVGWDPLFGGIIDINVDSSCFTPSPGDNPCPFTVSGGTFTDAMGNPWSIGTTDVGDTVRVDSSDILIGIQITVYDLTPLFEFGGCDGEYLSFALDKTVTFHCGGFPELEDTGTVRFITQVPEPATLALLGAALGVAGFVTRRRKLD